MKKRVSAIILMLMYTIQILLYDGYSVQAYNNGNIEEQVIEERAGTLEDIDNNGQIDIYDLSIIATSYESKKGENGYYERYDLNSDGIIDIYDLTIISKKIGSKVSLGVGSYEENNALVKYSGNWNSASNTLHSGGTGKYSSVKGDYIEIPFYGTGIDIYSYYGTNQGKANIYLDGKLVLTRDFYQPKAYYNKLSYYNHGLTLGEHVLKIEVLGQANSASTANNVSIDRIEILNNSISNNNYKVYQGNIEGQSWYIGQYPTKEAAINEAGLYSLTYVKDATEKEVWTNAYRVYQRLYNGRILNVKGMFKTKDEAIAIAKNYEWGYVQDPSGHDIWNRGYPAKIKTAILESYGPSPSHAKGSTTLAVGQDVTIINKEGTYYLIEYKVNNLTKKRVYVPTTNVDVSSKYIIKSASGSSIEMYSKVAQDVNGGPGDVSVYPKIGAIGLNEKVSRLADENGYSLIEYDTSSGRKRGYVSTTSLTTTQPVTIGYVYNTGSSQLKVRSTPDTTSESNVLGRLNPGDKVEIVDSSNSDWHKIKYNGGYGYVHKDYITFDKPNSNFPNSLDFYVNLQMKLKDPPQAYVNGGGWRNATTEEVRKYMNPDNFKNNSGKYMFMNLNYFDGIPLSSVKSALNGEGILSGKESTFLNAAKKYDVNPLYLIYHAILETGHGTSQLATGYMYNGKKVYNMYGIKAVDKDPLGEGSKFAYEQGWFTPELAIDGGAEWISKQYINSSYKQNTLYKMRWNLTNNGLGGHQYATDVAWAYTQSQLMSKFIESIPGITLEFEIPTFKLSLREIIRLIDEVGVDKIKEDLYSDTAVG